jgi:hypothetical protein
MILETLRPADNPMTWEVYNELSEYDFGIVRAVPWLDIGLTLLPSAQPMNDTPRLGKGTAIKVGANWRDYMRKINGAKEYRYAVEITGILWINIETEAGRDPKCETVMSAYNIVAWRKGDITNNFARLVCYPADMDTSTLDPRFDNWQNKPWMFWKGASYDEAGNVYLIGNGYHCFFPRIAQTELYMSLNIIETFPQGNYTFKNGVEIYRNGTRYYPQTRQVVA